MKAVVTGSEGFIGKVLCNKLKERNVEVVCIDRHLGIEAMSIGNYLDNDVFAVFHLAAQTSVFNEDLNQIAHDNINTFIEVVNQCNRFSIPLVYASSSTANDGNATSLYGLSKRFDEQFAGMYSKNARGVRLHNVYGPHPRAGTLLHCLMTQEEVTLYNNGNNIRCFTHVDDAADGIIASLDYKYPIVNVVNYEPIRIEEFARRVSHFNGVRINTTQECKNRDRTEQTVDRMIFTVPLRYMNVHVGVQSIFDNGKETTGRK